MLCVSVTTLTAVSLISTLKLNYEQLYHNILFIFNSWILIKMLCSEVMASFAAPQAPCRLERSGIEVTSQSRYVMLAAIGVQVANCAHSCSILLYRGFSEFYRLSTVSLDCRTLVAVYISVQIRQAPSRLRLFIPSIRSV